MAAAKNIVPVQHIRTAQRHAAAARPPKVRTLEELHQAINAADIPRYTSTEDGYRILSFWCPRSGSVVVTTRRQLDQLRAATMIHADATYKVVPRGLGRQLFTVHGNWDGFVRTLDNRR